MVSFTILTTIWLISWGISQSNLLETPRRWVQSWLGDFVGELVNCIVCTSFWVTLFFWANGYITLLQIGTCVFFIYLVNLWEEYLSAHSSEIYGRHS